MNVPSIKIYDDFEICVYFCFMLNNLGELGDGVISELIQTLETVNYFELMSETGRMEKKNLISVRQDKSRGERVYTLLPDGKVLAEEFYSRIPLSIREKTIDLGNEIIERIEREKTIRCSIVYDYRRDRCDLNVKFLNELNGEIILDLNLFAPDEERAKDMKERFLSKPSFIVERIMNMFLKDDFFMYDK